MQINQWIDGGDDAADNNNYYDNGKNTNSNDSVDNDDGGFVHLPTYAQIQTTVGSLAHRHFGTYVQLIAQPIQWKIICKWRIIRKTRSSFEHTWVCGLLSYTN